MIWHLPPHHRHPLSGKWRSYFQAMLPAPTSKKQISGVTLQWWFLKHFCFKMFNKKNTSGVVFMWTLPTTWCNYPLTWNSGEICLQGPHHVAVKSTTTSLSPEPLTYLLNSSCGKQNNCYKNASVSGSGLDRQLLGASPPASTWGPSISSYCLQNDRELSFHFSGHVHFRGSRRAASISRRII